MFKRRTIARLMAAASLTPAPALAQQSVPQSRIAFGSCADQAKPQPIWEAILAYRPEHFIFAGDNVYGDFQTAEAGNLRQAYDAATRIPGYAKLRDTVPISPSGTTTTTARTTVAWSFLTKPSPRKSS